MHGTGHSPFEHAAEVPRGGLGKHRASLIPVPFSPSSSRLALSSPSTRWRVCARCVYHPQALGLVTPFHAFCLALATRFKGALHQGTRAGPEPAAVFLTAGCRATGFEEEEVSMGAATMWLRRGFLKAPARAVAKVVGCYDGDVARLLDICRARIVFDSVCFALPLTLATAA